MARTRCQTERFVVLPLCVIFFPIITAKSNDISVSGHGGLSKNLTGEEASGFDDGAYQNFLYSWVLYS